MPQFEVFNRNVRPTRSDPLVAIQTKGAFSLNQAAFEALGEPEAVLLLMDRESRIMAFRAATLKDANSYRVRSVPRGKTYMVAGKAFCDRYEIPMERTRSYTAEKSDDLLTVDLKQQDGK